MGILKFVELEVEVFSEVLVFVFGEWELICKED